MNFKLPQFLFKSFLVTAVLFSCSHKGNTNLDSKKQDTLTKIEPPKTCFRKLPADYIENKRYSIERFFNKNWSDNSNISFLVAKDGQIIFEKYQGYANKNKGTTI